MNPHTMRITMTNVLLLGLAGGVFLAGCGPTFDPASLIETTRVVGARVEVEGAPERARPRPGETADVTWLVTSPEVAPPLRWTFALCLPALAGGTSAPGCDRTPLALFDGAASPPRVTIPVPAASILGAATNLILYGEICSGQDSTPAFDPRSGVPSCGGGGGTTVSFSIAVQLGDEINHNPVADRAFTFDGRAWGPLAAGDDPCVVGPHVSAGTKGHVIGNLSQGADREPYTAMVGDPAVATPVHETLQISQFTTAGELKSQFSFLDAAEVSATTTVEVKWNAPEAADVSAAEVPVTFTFVVRDDRGGIDWTTRVACVSR